MTDKQGNRPIDEPLRAHHIFIRCGSLFTPRLRSLLPISNDWSAASHPGALCPVMRFFSRTYLPNPTSLSVICGPSKQLSQAEHGLSTWNSVLTLPSWIRPKQWSWNGMVATPITEHVNPLKKLREVLMTCGRGRSVQLCGNEQRLVWEMRFIPNNSEPGAWCS